jgi:hypothetical protein
MLSHILPIHKWSIKDFLWAEPILKNLDKVFLGNQLTCRQTIQDITPGVVCQLDSLVLFLIGELLKTQNKSKAFINFHFDIKLQNAIDYMDKNYLLSPPLEKIAKNSFLAPNYFHRK